MRNIWFTSDSHFSHVNFLLFKDEDGKHIDEEWTQGPPYASAEIVLDEDDLTACSLEEKSSE